MKTKRVDAGLTSKDELAKRLLDGEVFYLNSLKVYYDTEANHENPFRLSCGRDSVTLNGVWGRYLELDMLVEVKWYEDIPEHGVVCWVSNQNPHPDANNVLKLIGGYYAEREEPYKDRNGFTSWVYATPLTDCEIKQYLRGE